MGSITDFLENELLDHIFNAAYTPPSTVYLALSTADPGDDGSGLSEPGDTYARQAITFGAASSRRVTQSGSISFPQATGSWGDVSHWAVCDASGTGAGNVMAHGAWGTTKTIVSGNTPTVNDGEVYVEFSAGEISDYLAEALLDFAFRNQALSEPDTYLGLATATIGDGDTGSTVTEVSGGGYARQQINPNGGADPTWNVAAGGSLDNAGTAEFATATADYGTVVAAFLADASTGGNLLLYDNDMADQHVQTDDQVRFLDGELDEALT